MTPKRDETYVFVYGTLKRGHGNYAVYLSDARFVGEVQTAKDFMMFGGGFPLCREPVPSDNLFHAGKVKGEIFAVNKDTLNRLDALEGHPHFYERRITAIEEYPATSIWMYHWNNENGRVEGRQETPKRDGIDMLHNWKPGRAW